MYNLPISSLLIEYTTLITTLTTDNMAKNYKFCNLCTGIIKILMSLNFEKNLLGTDNTHSINRVHQVLCCECFQVLNSVPSIIHWWSVQSGMHPLFSCSVSSLKIYKWGGRRSVEMVDITIKPTPRFFSNLPFVTDCI